MNTLAQAAPPDLPSFTRREVLIVIVGVMMVFFLASLDQAIVATALPHMAADLDGDAHLSWVVSGYLLASTAMTPIYGKLSDFYGRKLLLQVAIGIFVAASALCGLAQSMPMLIACRILQGIGCGGLFSMAQATVGDVVAPRERGRYQGYISINYVLSSVLGPVLGGFFSDHLSWRWIFWINLPIGLAALVMAGVALKSLKAPGIRHRIDYPGAVLIVAALTAILLVTTTGGTDLPWHSAGMALLMGLAALLVAIAVLWEWRAEEAILPPRLFRTPGFGVAVTASLLNALCLMGASVFLPLFLQLDFGLSASMAGLLVIAQTLGVVCGAFPAGQWVTRTGHYRVLPILGTLLSAAGFVLLSLVDRATPLSVVGFAMMLASMGCGLCMPPLLIAVQNAVDPRDLGAGTASVNCFRSMGASFGVALFGAVLVARLDAGLRQAGLGGISAVGLLHQGPSAISGAPAALRGAVAAAMDQAFRDTFRTGAAIGLLGFCVALRLKEIPLRTTPGLVAAAEAGLEMR